MKKSLVLAMAMALGVTASAYAANPFSDVPAGHWAYDSIEKLAAAGVIEGYGDTTFGGDKLMTRYEMAQIVAKAMAKGANCDKLAAEFADELNNLGVRVANLEKNADNVKITGQVRYEYATRQGTVGHNVAKNRLRSRLFVNGAVNEDWSYTARIQNDQDLSNNTGDETTNLNQAYVNGRIGGLKVLAGKGDQVLGNGYIYDDTAELVRLTYGKDVKVSAYAGKPTDYGFKHFYGGELSAKMGNFSLSAGYDKFQDFAQVKNEDTGKPIYNQYVDKDGQDDAIWNVSAAYKMGAVALNATYLNSDADLDADTDGYVVGLAIKGADKNKVGSWGLWANYYDQGAGTFIAHTMKSPDWRNFVQEGFKGYNVGANLTLAKNMVYSVDYYDLEGKKSDADSRVLWNRLQIMF